MIFSSCSHWFSNFIAAIFFLEEENFIVYRHCVSTLHLSANRNLGCFHVGRIFFLLHTQKCPWVTAFIDYVTVQRPYMGVPYVLSYRLYFQQCLLCYSGYKFSFHYRGKLFLVLYPSMCWKLHFEYLLKCVCVCVCIPQYRCWGQRTDVWIYFLMFKLSLSALEITVLNQWSILLTLKSVFKKFTLVNTKAIFQAGSQIRCIFKPAHYRTKAIPHTRWIYWAHLVAVFKLIEKNTSYVIVTLEKSLQKELLLFALKNPYWYCWDVLCFST